MGIKNKVSIKRMIGIIMLTLVILIVIFLGFQYNKFLKIKSENIEDINSKSIIVETEEGIIEYAVEGQGEAILMIHGAGGGYDQGLLLADNFLPKGYKVISISRFGYLNTPLSKNPTTDNQAALYKALLDKLGLEKVNIVAVSDGGPSALKFSINYPEYVKSLTLMCAKSQTPPKLTKSQAIAFNTIFNNDFIFWLITEYIQSDLLNILGVSKEVQANMTKDEMNMAREFFGIMNPISLRKDGIFDANVQFKELSPQDYPIWKIKAPTLIIHAKDDTLQPFYYAQYSKEKIPNSKLISFKEGGHMFFSHHEQIKNEIKLFLEYN